MRKSSRSNFTCFFHWDSTTTAVVNGTFNLAAALPPRSADSNWFLSSCPLRSETTPMIGLLGTRVFRYDLWDDPPSLPLLNY